MYKTEEVHWPTISKTISALLHWDYNHSGWILLFQAHLFASSRLCASTGTLQPISLSECPPTEAQNSDGWPLQEAWQLKGTDVSHWKMIRCQSWWQQHLDPPRSSFLRQARGRQVCCHPQWWKCYRSVSWKLYNKSTGMQTRVRDNHQYSLKHVRIQTLQDHFIPYSHNWNSLWQIKHLLIYIWVFFFSPNSPLEDFSNDLPLEPFSSIGHNLGLWPLSWHSLQLLLLFVALVQSEQAATWNIQINKSVKKCFK